MKKELTREALEALRGCEEKDDCDLCPSNDFCNRKDAFGREALLATALLEEMDKPKVWDGAPEDAIDASVAFFKKGEYLNPVCKTYTRELPKTRIDKIVEEVIDGRLFGLRMEKSELTEMLKSALEKYAAELNNGGK